MNEHEERFSEALEKLVRLAIAANDATVLPPRHRNVWSNANPVFFAGMYVHLMPAEERVKLAQEAAKLESCLGKAIERLHVPHPPDRRGQEVDGYRAIISEWQQVVHRTLHGPLPPCPTEEQFESSEAHDEARGRWLETVGRTKAMAAPSRS